MAQIVVAEDNDGLRQALGYALGQDGHRVYLSQDGPEALANVKRNPPDILITDLRMPEMDGIELLGQVKTISPTTAVILITAYADVETAVEAMKRGAHDYIRKPFSMDELTMAVGKLLTRQRLDEEAEYLREGVREQYQFDNIVGSSQAIENILAMIKRVAGSKAAILIRGESGTGKELVAGAIHYDSLRKDKPFIKVNVAALPETLLESELFGHEKGAFTGASARRRGRFELADGGSIFLDEIGEMSLSMQVRLLRVLQENEFERVGGSEVLKVDVRVMSSTNRDLEKAIQEGKFREDLYYRLNVIPIVLPPLRQRREDIPMLAHHFLKKYNREANREVRSFHPGAMRLLMDHDWPGNIRELENAIERCVVLSPGETILPEHLPLGAERASDQRDRVLEESSVNDMLHKAERAQIVKALEKTHGVQVEAARLLGLKRTTLRYRIRKHKWVKDPERVRVNFKARCRLIDTELGNKPTEFRQVRVINISSGGMLLKWPRRWKVDGCNYCFEWFFGRECPDKECPYAQRKAKTKALAPLATELDMKMPGQGERLRFQAKVLRLSRSSQGEFYNMAVQYNDISSEQRKIIREFIQELRSQEAGAEEEEEGGPG